MKNSLDELKETLERIRLEKYPSVPKELITEIIEAQYENQDNPARRESETQRIIYKYASELTVEDGDQ